MDAVDRFAIEATAFEHWVRSGTDIGERAAREALVRLTRLYLAGLELPSHWLGDENDKSLTERVGDEEYSAVLTATNRLPFEAYGEVFDPTVIPPQTPVCGSLSDDIADIYRDVVTGLREYQAGRRNAALREWGFLLQIHWGEHATGAIRALHRWLTVNSFELFATAEPGA